MGSITVNARELRLSDMLVKNIAGKLMWVFITILFIMFSVYSGRYDEIILSMLLILIIVTYSAQSRMKFRFKISYLHYYIVLFMIFEAISSLWAEVPEYSTRGILPLMKTLMAMIVLFSCCGKEGSVDNMLRALMWRGYIVLAYVLAKYGFNTLVFLINNDMRIDNEVLNANTIGLMASYSIIINCYYIQKNKKVRLLDLLVIPAFLFITVSGSRKGLLLVVGGVMGVQIIRNWDNKRWLKSISKIVLGMVVFLIVAIFIIQLPFMRGILGRMDDLFIVLKGEGRKGVSGYVRMEYLKLGIQIFMKHPLIGIGIDNSRLYTIKLFGLNHYLHNNYVELLACGGIIGAAIYYWIYIYLLDRFRKYRRFRDAEYDICFILLIGALVMEFGMVTYDSPETYYMLLLFCLEADKLRNCAKNRQSLINIAKQSGEYYEVELS